MLQLHQYTEETLVIALIEGCNKKKYERFRRASLTAETVQSTSLTLESIDDVKRSYSLAFGVFSVGNGITNDVLQKDLEYTTGFLIAKV
jgi:hypothetical protein